MLEHTCYNSRLVQLEVISGRAVSPSGLVGDFGPAQWTSVLTVQPRRDTQFTEDVAASQPHRGRVVIVTDGTRVTGRQQLFTSRFCAEVLRK